MYKRRVAPLRSLSCPQRHLHSVFRHVNDHEDRYLCDRHINAPFGEEIPTSFDLAHVTPPRPAHLNGELQHLVDPEEPAKINTTNCKLKSSNNQRETPYESNSSTRSLMTTDDRNISRTSHVLSVENRRPRSRQSRIRRLIPHVASPQFLRLQQSSETYYVKPSEIIFALPKNSNTSQSQTALNATADTTNPIRYSDPPTHPGCYHPKTHSTDNCWTKEKEKLEEHKPEKTKEKVIHAAWMGKEPDSDSEPPP